jgi:hypothetical protein
MSLTAAVVLTLGAISAYGVVEASAPAEAANARSSATEPPPEISAAAISSVGAASASGTAVRGARINIPGSPAPRPDTVGVPATYPLRRISPSQIVSGGRYDGVLVTGGFELPKGWAPVTFTNCRIEGSITTYVTLNLTFCTLTAGLYAYDTGGTITSTLIDSDAGQAFRPGVANRNNDYAVPTPWVVTNSYFRVRQGVPPAHVEASQVLGGVGIRFTNVVFDTGGPFNNTQTADLNFIGKDLVCEDCYFPGYGGYSIYSEGPNNVFIRPHFGKNAPFGRLYPNSVQKAIIYDPRDLVGNPI